MKKYIVVTTGGFTLDDNNLEINNMQVVCLCLAMNKSDAINRAIACADSMEHDFSNGRYIAYEIASGEPI